MSTSPRIALVSAGLAAAAVVGVTAALASSGSGTADGRKAAPSRAALRGVNFVGVCGFSHIASDDPIVYPGLPGVSHSHTFVGNTSTNANSTLASLLASSTTCRRPGETAAYWLPTLIVDGAATPPLGATVYYRRKTLAPVTPFPAGFRMIAGDAKASIPQSERVTFWNCGVLAGIPRSSTPPVCPASRATVLRLHVEFPDCWDGRSLDSIDHRSHVAYSVRGVCPASHPVALPAIELIYRYPVTGEHAIALSSGGQLSAHGDFFNAWSESALTALVDGCLNALRHCGRGA